MSYPIGYDGAKLFFVRGGLRFESAVAGASENHSIFYENPVTRFYVGDGTGYSLTFSRRIGSVTTDFFTITDNGLITLSRRINNAQGAAVASANDMTLGTDGNTFHITGTTTINRIATASFQAGSVIKLHFDSNPTIAHLGAATGGGFARIHLRFSNNVTAETGMQMELRYDGTDWWQSGVVVRP